MQSAYSNKDGQIKNLRSYMKDRTVLDIAATNNCYAFIMDDGSLVVFGAAEYGERDIPAETLNEKMVSIQAGTRHFVAVGESGTVYTWGHNDGGQCDVAGETTDIVYTGAKQTYLVNAEGELTDKSGFSGYVMGTDGRGRDILTRIVHGGKMTMTIGAVAVVVSTIIAVPALRDDAFLCDSYHVHQRDDANLHHHDYARSAELDRSGSYDPCAGAGRA